MIAAVLFDLDDTLFPQASWLAGAWDAVSMAAEPFGVDPPQLRAHLGAIAAEGSARGRIIDRALVAVGADHVPVPPLLAAFRAHRPSVLPPYPGVAAALARLRSVVPIGLVTDGDVDGQMAKLAALGLFDTFDAVVLSDTFGREFRKPNPRPFQAGLEQLGIDPAEAVFIGDHPEKDVVGSTSVGMRAIRVLTGEYSHLRPAEQCWMVAEHVVEAIDLLWRSERWPASPGRALARPAPTAGGATS